MSLITGWLVKLATRILRDQLRDDQERVERLMERLEARSMTCQYLEQQIGAREREIESVRVLAGTRADEVRALQDKLVATEALVTSGVQEIDSLRKEMVIQANDLKKQNYQIEKMRIIIESLRALSDRSLSSATAINKSTIELIEEYRKI